MYEKEKKMWKRFFQYHWGFRKKLRIDNKMCDLILGNKKVYGRMYFDDFADHKHISIFRCKVSRNPVLVDTPINWSKRKYKLRDSRRCYGMSRDLGSGELTGYIYQMKYLSEALVAFAAFHARRAR